MVLLLRNLAKELLLLLLLLLFYITSYRNFLEFSKKKLIQEAYIIIKEVAFGTKVLPHANPTLNAVLLNLISYQRKIKTLLWTLYLSLSFQKNNENTILQFWRHTSCSVLHMEQITWKATMLNFSVLIVIFYII